MTEPTLARAVRRAAVRATLAPSIDNSQPWRFVLSASNLEVHADWRRRLRVLDPRGRQLLISCGCAVFNARVAFAAAGYQAMVDRFPDPAQPNLLARLTPHDPSSNDTPIGALDAVLDRCHTNPQAFSVDPTPADLVHVLVGVAKEEGVELFPITRLEHRLATARLSQQADRIENADPNQAELRAWTTGDPRGLEDQCLLLLGTGQDTPAAWLRTGEALERVLLEITRHGYAASPLTQVIEVATANALLRHELQLAMHAHLLLRVGRAPAAPSSRRRRLVDVLEEAR
jgi:hypothetical protein